MAEIGNIRHTPPVNWTSQTKLKPSDQKKDQRSRHEAENKDEQDTDDDNNHIDEYA